MSNFLFFAAAGGRGEGRRVWPSPAARIPCEERGGPFSGIFEQNYGEKREEPLRALFILSKPCASQNVTISFQ